MLDIDIQLQEDEDEDEAQGDYKRKIQAINNDIEGNKRDKVKLDNYIQKNNDQIERLKLQLKNQEEGFENKCMELQSLKMTSLNKTNQYNVLNNDIETRQKKLLDLQADITVTSMKWSELVEDNDFLINIAPLLDTASKKNQKFAFNLKKLSSQSLKEFQEIAGEYLKK